LLLTLTGPAHALPEDPGGHDVDTLTRTESIAGVSVPFDLYLPKGLSAPAPVVVVGHGFQRTKANMAEWGDELARRGYVAAVPSFPGADRSLNATILTGLLAWIEAEATKPASPLSGVVDGSRRAAIGFSAGGTAALVAAASDSTIDLVVGLDPVDDSEKIGAQTAPSIQAPVVFVRAEPSQCNSNGNAEEVFVKLTGPRLSLMVVGASHCDGEAPSGPLCAVLCGAQVRARHLLFRRYAFASLDYLLRCEAAMAPWLGGAQAQADTGIKDLAADAFPPPPEGCTAVPDAGPPADAVLDRGAARDLGQSPDTASGDGPGPADEGDGGCSCRAAGDPREGPIWVGIGLLLALWRTRRSIT
jgi:MYXO-CTERM domain-containing protein